MKDEEPGGLDGFGDEVSRMLHARASRHPEATDPIGITKRDLKAARGRRQIMAGTTATLAVAAVAVVGVQAAHPGDKGRPQIAIAVNTARPTTPAKSDAAQDSQIVVTAHEWSKDVIADLIAQRKWKQADFDAVIADNTIGLPAWSVSSTDHRFTVEGMLEPGSYTITASDTPQSVLTRMVAPRMAFLRSIGFETKAVAQTCGRVACTPEQVLTVASIAESEVVDPTDGSKVAEGLYNRLAEPDYLAVDSTALYGLGQHLPTGQPPTHQQVNDPNNPYSTYAHLGLPPTPIAVTSDAMVNAALAPTRQGTYYWCTTPTGTEFFKRSQSSAFRSACDVK